MISTAAWRRGLAQLQSADGRREALLSSPVVVTVSTGARALFGLAFAGVMVAQFPPQLAVELFQLLLLQTIFVTFVSGSGYARAVSAGATEEGAAQLLRGYGVFVFITVIVIAVFERAILPREIVDRFVSPDRWKLYVLLAGGVAAGSLGIFQGAIVRAVGSARVFLPMAAVSIAFTLALGAFFIFDLSGGALVVVYALYQIATLLVFFFANLGVTDRLFRRAMGSGNTQLASSADALGFGGVNTAVLLVFFLFRDLWSHHVEPKQAAAAFFAVRISETYLGILFYVAAGSPLLARFDSQRTLGARLLTSLAITNLIGLIGIGAAICGMLSLHDVIPLVVLCLVAQGLGDVLRTPSSLATILELQQGTIASFALVALPATVAGALIALWLTPSAPLFSFYLFQLVMSAGQIGAAIAHRAYLERRGGS